MNTVDIQLRAEWIVGVGYRYDLLLDGKVIVRRSRDPEHDGARALHARGLRGRFRTIDLRTGKHRMTLDIEQASRLCIVERDLGGLRVERYRPLGQEARTALHAPPVHQGRVTRQTVASSAAHRDKRAGGKTAAASRRIPENA